MFLVNLIVAIIFVYLLIYSIYLLTLNIKSFSAKKYLEEKAPSEEMSAQNKFCIIVWTQNKDKNTLNILQSLNTQTYNSENYEVHMIDVCKDKAFKKLPDFANGARIYQIENPEFFSKDKALSVFVEKIMSDKEKHFDGFIFLNSDRVIKQDFIEKINKNFENDIILTGKLDVVKNNSTTLDLVLSNVLHAKQKFTNHTLNISRAMFSLVNIIDGGACVVPSNILEKTGRVCFETKNDELKYSLFLASNKIKTVYCPFVETEVEAFDFDVSSAQFSQKIMLLKYYLPLLFKKPWYFVEYVLSILKPNVIFALIAYFGILYLSFKYYTLAVSVKHIIHLGAFLLFNIVLGIFSSGLNLMELASLPFYPFCASALKYKLVAKNLTIKSIERQNQEEENVNSATIKSYVGNGKKNIPCKLDLVTEDGMRKVVFRYNRKKLFSDSHLRMYDALNDIAVRLKDKGFILKICQNCEHFVSQPDGTMDLLKGVCKLRPKEEETFEEILVWNGCTGFCAKKDNEIIKIDDLKNDRD